MASKVKEFLKKLAKGLLNEVPGGGLISEFVLDRNEEKRLEELENSIKRLNPKDQEIDKSIENLIKELPKEQRDLLRKKALDYANAKSGDKEKKGEDLKNTMVNVLSTEDANQSINNSIMANRFAVAGDDKEFAAGELLPGGRFEVLQTMGRGSMGVVYKVRDQVSDEIRCLKIISRHLCKHAEAVNRFKAEYKITRDLTHDNIIRIIDIGQMPDGVLYYTMEFVEGKSLRRLLNAQGRLEWGPAFPLIKMLCFALSNAHSKRVYHLDIKPENLIVTHHNVLKVIDFGIAKAFAHNAAGGFMGQSAGAPDYIPHEQKVGLDCDHRADIYSVGVVTYELLTGEIPSFTSQPVHRENPTVPEKVHEIIFKAMAKKPDDRYTSIMDFLNALEFSTGGTKSPVKQKEAVKNRDEEYETKVKEIIAEAEKALKSGNLQKALDQFYRAGDMILDAEKAVVEPAIRSRILDLSGSVLKKIEEIKFKQKETRRDVVKGVGTMQCPHCASTIAKDSKQCEWCLKPVAETKKEIEPQPKGATIRCPHCKSGIAAAAAKCEWCGKEVKAAAGGAGWKEVARFSGHTDAIRAVVFTRDGKSMVTAGYDRQIRILNSASLAEAKSIKGHPDSICSLAISPNGKLLASGAFKSIKLWSFPEMKEVLHISDLSQWIVSLSFSPKKRQIAAAEVCTDAVCKHGSHPVRIYDADSGRLLHRLAGHRDNVWSICYSGAGDVVATGSYDGTVKFWNPALGNQTGSLDCGGAGVASIAISPDGKYLAAGLGDQTVRVWEIGSLRFVRSFEGSKNYLRTVAFSSDGKLLAAGGADNIVRVFEVGSGKCHGTLEAHSAQVWQVAFSPKDAHLATVGEDKKVILWGQRS